MAFDVAFADLRAAAKAAGGSVNDAFLSALLGGFRRYHIEMGSPIERMPIAIPVSVRREGDPAGGNRFAGARLAGPVGIADPARRIQAINNLVEGARAATLPCSADLGAAHVLLMPSTHPVINAQRTIDALLNGGRARLPIYGGTPPGSDGVLSDVRLSARWVMSAVDQRQLEHHVPRDFSRVVALHRTSTAWPHGRYWRSARTVPSALDIATGVTVALSLMSMPNTATAASVLQQLMAGANNGGPYRRPISRRAHLSQALRSVHDAAHTNDNADRRLRSRLARKQATSASVSTRSPNWVR
jgi:hypothetical protein